MDDYGSALGAEHFTHDPHDPALTINLAELLDHIGPARALDPCVVSVSRRAARLPTLPPAGAGTSSSRAFQS
jgi:hypothetical protein